MQWYWSRIKCMSPAEIGYRVRKTAYMQSQKIGFFTATNIPEMELNDRLNNFIFASDKINAQLYLKSADAIIAGDFDIFAHKHSNMGSIPEWNKDLKSGITAPLVFGKTLNYRDFSLVGDIKYLWEPNRHLQLVVIAQAYKLSGRKYYLDALLAQLNSWFDQCPYQLGANWTSSLELGIRLINWSLVWQLIGGIKSEIFNSEEGKKFRTRWLNFIFQHCHFIHGHLSGYSSANNHLIGEVAGLFVATITWPFWEVCDSWRGVSRVILEREVLQQNAKDGVNLEQAVSYQQFVLDFLLISALAGKRNNISFSDDYWKMLAKMMEYLSSIMDVNGNVPMIGDADDGYVFSLSQEKNWCPYRSLLATGAVIFGRDDFYEKAKCIDDKTLWLMGNEASEKSKLFKKPVTSSIKQEFAVGGYYVLGCEFESPNEIKLVVDCGPLGYQGIAAHGHADALAFTLNLHGKEFLVDPGTYAYHTQKKWRDYFRGTSAHNTIRVDEADQSVSGGNFMWLRKAKSVCETWNSSDKIDHFVGNHNGYTRFSDGVTHQRQITLDKTERKIVVLDTLSCKRSHKIECFWHFSEDCKLELLGNTVKAYNSGVELVLEVEDDESSLVLVHGDETRPLGWVSRSYDVKVASTVAVLSRKIEGTSHIKTIIYCS